MEIRNIGIADYPEISAIYLEGINTGNATFETQAPTWEEWEQGHLMECSYALFIENRMAGWVALSPVSSRAVYAGVAQISIYISSEFQGQGFGKTLMQQVIIESEKQGIWTIFASIFPVNEPSLQLHRSFDFREIGFRERIAQFNGVWRSTIIMERRSKIVGYKSQLCIKE